MNRLSNTTLINQRGDRVFASSADGLRDKVCMLYFSASWCPPCRQFTPMLKRFHAEFLKDSKVEIVFVSNDKTEADMTEYFRGHHGDYLAIKYGESAMGELSKEVGIKGIPTVVVVDTNGRVVVPCDEARQIGTTHYTPMRIYPQNTMTLTLKHPLPLPLLLSQWL